MWENPNCNSSRTKSFKKFYIEVKNQMFLGTLTQASPMNVKKLMFE